MFQIDTHFHVFSAQAPAVGGARYRPAYGASLAQWQALSGVHGVRAGVVVQPSFFGTDNSELEAALATSCALRGVCVLGPEASAGELARLHGIGVRGLRWNMVGRQDDPAWRDARWPVLLEAAHALGWHLELHTEPGRLAELREWLPPVPIALVLDHFGKPAGGAQGDARMLACARHWREQREVYVKLSAPYRVGAGLAGVVADWLHCLGEQALLWGSDWPWTNHEAQASYAGLQRGVWDWLGPSREAPDRNAARLFGMPAMP
ncbi:amidohydrolase family protein [Cupriavidus basilensis]|uniref:Amidohydrolase family protein n=1 Tax=Cupriavidus basilensis TaxID=68895 RepID=A0ABT6AVE0_9BURK|nr:amidohydrolase family protein [Cupriavidus basilensis]MDF3836597.1 amidohydrolase family protein [Cupriavidus basilensis]